MNGPHYGLRETAEMQPPSILRRFEGAASPASTPRVFSVNHEQINHLEAAVVGNSEHRHELLAQLDNEIAAAASCLQRLRDLRQMTCAMAKNPAAAEPAG